MEIDVLGIDLAKRVFQLHGATRTGVVVHRSKVSRPKDHTSQRRTTLLIALAVAVPQFPAFAAHGMP